MDIHQKLVVACVIAPGADGQPSKTIRTFGTMTDDVLALADWLTSQQVTHVVMESTGVYWKPFFNLLEGSFDLLLVNAQHVKQVPGRKTDVQDAEWLADLLRHGLLRSSFVPDRTQGALRELTRYRTSLVRARATEAARLQKTLEGANIKLASVASDVLGASGRAMLAALVEGTDDPMVLADLARGKLREKLPLLERALAGCMAPHQRFLLDERLAHIAYLEEAIARLSVEVTERLAKEEAAIQQLDAIPGVARRTAEILVAEIGTDMRRFPSAGHLASWAGLCPGHHESAGRRQSGSTRKGSPWLRTALIEAAHAASHTKDTYLAAQYHRLAARQGARRALVAVAHTILVIVYHLLRDGTVYEDLGETYFDERDKARITQRLVQRLQGLGVTVAVSSTAT